MKMVRHFGILAMLIGLGNACSDADVTKEPLPQLDMAGDGPDETDQGHNSDPGCEDECQEGVMVCDGGGSFRVCGQFDSDSCVEFSEPISCPSGHACEVDRCVPPCVDECVGGTTICLDENTVGTCGNFDADVCLEAGGPVACGTNERCEQGACVDASAACTDECATGETVCSGDSVRSCGQYDSDPCLDLGPAQPCALGESCNAGACSLACVNTCSNEGATECSGNGVRTCERSGSGCLSWTSVAPCAASESCSNGTCSDTCEDECPVSGESICSPDGTAVSTCGQFDADTCLDRSTPVPCPTGQACQGGSCVATCTDECGQGATRCVGNALETCGNFDADPCLEWGGAVTCPNGANCSNNTCELACTDECTTMGAVECSGNGFRTCGQFDLDSCLEWSSVTNCQSFEVCSTGTCVLGPTPAQVLINEVVYDAVGSDTAAGNNLFVELKGPPNQSLEGYIVIGVNGADNADYNTISLSGRSIAADGFFLIAHPNGDPTLVALADMTSTAVDYQNGPDSIQVRWRGRVVDALAYGNFGSNHFFAGEGTAAPSTPPGQSLSRDALSTDTDDNSVDFTLQPLPTPRGTPSGCTDLCTMGQTRCSGGQLQTCGNFDADPCLEWSTPTDCPGGGTCANGICSAACTDECTAGQTRCDGTLVQTCGDYDADPCLEWGTSMSCGSGSQCANGSCTQQCPAGTHLCSGTCVSNFSVDSCGTSCTPCVPPANSTATCNGTSCGFSCDDGYEQCTSSCAEMTGTTTLKEHPPGPWGFFLSTYEDMTWGFDSMERLHYAWMVKRTVSSQFNIEVHIGRVGGTDNVVRTFTNVGTYPRLGIAMTHDIGSDLCFVYWVNGHVYESCNSTWTPTLVGTTFDYAISVASSGRGQVHVVDATPTAIRYKSPSGAFSNIETYAFANTPRVLETALTLDSNGNPHVLYIMQISGQNYVKYARWTGTAWNVSTVENITQQNNGPGSYEGSLAILAAPGNQIHLAWTRRWVQTAGFSIDREDVRHAVATGSTISGAVNVVQGYAMTGAFVDSAYNTNLVQLALDADGEVMLGYAYVSTNTSTDSRETWLARHNSGTGIFSTARFSGLQRPRTLGRLGIDNHDRPSMLHESWLRYRSYCP